MPQTCVTIAPVRLEWSARPLDGSRVAQIRTVVLRWWAASVVSALSMVWVTQRLGPFAVAALFPVIVDPAKGWIKSRQWRSERRRLRISEQAPRLRIRL
jgi:hypothetical protein